MAGGLIVVSGPSGSGKTTIARTLLRDMPSFRFSVSATTRPMRTGEREGVDYHYLSRDEFQRRVAAGEFVEWEEVYGNLYGTLRVEVDGALARGQNLLFDVDVKGALSIKERYPGALLIFIRPPSRATLEARLRARSTEDESTVLRRLARTDMELELGSRFDRQVVNDALDRAIAETKRIVEQYLQLNERRV
ncbi:MAG: guanylate kinase [Bacteroidetes bacterium]|nr:guanylate kinase [Bacteroidota bacterium]